MQSQGMKTLILHRQSRHFVTVASEAISLSVIALKIQRAVQPISTISIC